MPTVQSKILRELLRNGYAPSEGKKTWEITDPSFAYLTSASAEGFMTLEQYDVFKRQVIGREVALIKEYTAKFISNARLKTFNVIDLGCGTGERAVSWLSTLDSNVKVRYCPVDVNERFVNQAVRNVKNAKLKQVVEIKPFVDQFSNLSHIEAMVRNSTYQNNVILLLGTTLAHYEINEFLFKISRRMVPNDYFILGNSIRTGERLVSLKTYQHESFNAWLFPIMKELGFKPSEVTYDARFANSRIECFYKLKTEKNFIVDGKKIKLSKGDEIIVTVLYKYYEMELAKFCKMYFRDVELVKDVDNEYALVLCKK